MWNLESNKSFWHEGSQPENEANTWGGGVGGGSKRGTEECPATVLS